jgi:hypothetical protein
MCPGAVDDDSEWQSNHAVPNTDPAIAGDERLIIEIDLHGKPLTLSG